MTSHQTQERRASLLPSAATAEGATRSPQDAPSAPIREETDFPGPHSPTVSGGIPGTPSSDALRAQKSGGTGIPVRGRDAEGVTHHRKSLRAANEFTDSLGCGGASASSTFFGCETVSKGQPAGISRPLDDRLENRTVQDRPAHNHVEGVTAWHLNLKWTVADTDLMLAAARRGQTPTQIARTIRRETGNPCAPHEVERVLRNADVLFAEQSA